MQLASVSVLVKCDVGEVCSELYRLHFLCSLWLEYIRMHVNCPFSPEEKPRV